MREATALFAPTVEARDVLESFLSDQILIDDWAETLRAASAQFGELGTRWSDDEITHLAERLKLLASHGLDEEVRLAESVAVDIATLLDQVAVAGNPGPDSDGWQF